VRQGVGKEPELKLPIQPIAVFVREHRAAEIDAFDDGPVSAFVAAAEDVCRIFRYVHDFAGYSGGKLEVFIKFDHGPDVGYRAPWVNASRRSRLA